MKLNVKAWVLPFLLLSLVMTSCKDQVKESENETGERNLDSLLVQFPDSMDLLIEQGNHYLDAYLYSEALELGAKAFRLDTNNIEARFLYASALNNIQSRSVVDIDQAQKHFEKVVAAQPKNKKAYIALASTYTQQGEFDRSFEYINQVLRMDKRYRDAYIMKGSNYLALGNRELAKSSYETAIQQDPEFYEGYMALAYLYTEEEDPLALQYFLTASTLKPNSTDALYGVAYSHQVAGSYDEALISYRHLLEIDQEYHLALFNQGYIKQFYQEQIDSAIYYYSSAIDIQPEFVKAWHNMGLCYVSKSDKTQALKCFGKALKYNPEYELSKLEAEKLR